MAAVLVAGGAFLLYLYTLAPGFSWAHQGADGGELIAAAVTRGVPHPPGYPLYTLLLSAWLGLWGWLAPTSDVAWRGNLLSALCAAASAGVTVLVANALLEPALARRRWLWATLAGIAWAASPLLWSQALITEVYGLHALIVALLGWVLLASRRRWGLLVFPVALGVAHHITLILLLPAALWLVWAAERDLRRLLGAIGWIALGGAVGAAFYLYIPFVGAAHAAPVNWGYVSNVEEFWWLISGAAYRAYLFATPTANILGRVAQWAYTLAVQYTPIGLLVALAGLARLDQQRPALRTFGLIWIVPLSIYAIGYFTRDSEIYLLPVTWMFALWLGLGLQLCATWLERETFVAGRGPALVATLCAIALVVNLALFWGQTSLRQDDEARRWLEEMDAALPARSIIVSRGDKETFALWYGIWGNMMLADKDPVAVNDSLYQFAWYRRLQGDLYPDLPGANESADALVEQNWLARPVYYVEELPVPPGMELIPQPSVSIPLWRLEGVGD